MRDEMYGDRIWETDKAIFILRHTAKGKDLIVAALDKESAIGVEEVIPF